MQCNIIYNFLTNLNQNLHIFKLVLDFFLSVSETLRLTEMLTWVGIKVSPSPCFGATGAVLRAESVFHQIHCPALLPGPFQF